MRLLRTEIEDDGVVALVALDPDGPRVVSDAPGLLDAVLEALPGISRHRCTSPESGLLASELPVTEIAHLLEHMTLEYLVLQGHPRTVSGRTTWDWSRDGEAVYRITITGTPSEDALAALESEVARLAVILSSLPAD